MITADVKSTARAAAQPAAHERAAPQIGLEQYYSEAGPDYAAWSSEFNMHFGYYRTGANPLHRVSMLEQMNAEVLDRLHVRGIAEPRLLDLGCGLGATLRSSPPDLRHISRSTGGRLPRLVLTATTLATAIGSRRRRQTNSGHAPYTVALSRTCQKASSQ